MVVIAVVRAKVLRAGERVTSDPLIVSSRRSVGPDHLGANWTFRFFVNQHSPAPIAAIFPSIIPDISAPICSQRAGVAVRYSSDSLAMRAACRLSDCRRGAVVVWCMVGLIVTATARRWQLLRNSAQNQGYHWFGPLEL